MPSARLASDVAVYYTAQSTFSDPGDQATYYAGLPADPAQLAQTARNLMIHRLEGGVFRCDIPRDRLHGDAETRYLDDILRLITSRDAAPLTVRRDLGDRFVGTCRDFTLLHCSLLRHAGIPARLRSGFADYFGTDGFHSDHVVTEYFDVRRGWLLADAQLPDPLVMDAHKIDFNPMDVPRDRFVVAGAAWRAIRSGAADPQTFGVHLPDAPALTGAWFVAHDVLLDLAALNKTETLLWDVWGAGAASDAELTEEISALYDQVAALTHADVPFAEVRKLFTEHDDLRTPATIRSLAQYTGPADVTLR
jgi:hypothetical protein